jgi:hypothetical protein
MCLTVHRYEYGEIKCQLDATDGSLLQNLLFAQHVSGTIMPIIRSSRVLHRWLLLVVLGALVFKLSVWRGVVGCVSGLRDAALASRIMPIIRSSRVLYRWLLLVVLGDLVFKLSV